MAPFATASTQRGVLYNRYRIGCARLATVPGRGAYRHGDDNREVTLGGRRVAVRCPRVRTANNSWELAVPTYEAFSSAELLGAMALEKMMTKISTRRYRAGLEPVGSEVEAASGSTSKSPVSRRFVKVTEGRLGQLTGAELSGLDRVALLVDSVHFGGHFCVVAVGVDADGHEHPSEWWRARPRTLHQESLPGEGPDVTRPALVVIDGVKALSAAVLPGIRRKRKHGLPRIQKSRASPTLVRIPLTMP